MGSNKHNPIHRSINLKADDEEEVSPGQMTVNMCTWLFNVYTAAFWFWIPAFFGDFEAYFFYIREQNELLPPALRYHTQEYFNRFDGVIMGFRNTSYTPPPSNWTVPPEHHDEDDIDSDPIDGTGVIDLNGGKKKKKKVRTSEEVKLHFLPDDADEHYQMKYDDDKYESKA